MGVPDERLFKLGPWSEGIDNVHNETDMPVDKDGRVVALREAVNIDLNDFGKASSRSGYNKVASCTLGHSIFNEGQFPYVLYVDNNTLYATQFNGAPIELAPNIAPAQISYRLVNDAVYWSNVKQNGILYADLTLTPWGVETPLGQPTLAVTTGALNPGRYQVAVTFRNMKGEEGGTSIASVIDVPAGGGIALSDVPQPLGTDIAEVRVYMTPDNGDVLYRSRSMPLGMTSGSLLQRPTGIPCATQFLDPMPPGQFVDYLGGRMYVAAGNVLYWSEALRFGLTRLDFNRFRVGDGIRMLIAVGEGTDDAGMYVADGVRTYFLHGPDPLKFNRKIAYSCGAIQGTQARVPGSYFGLDTTQPVAYWIAQNGVACLGLPGGVVQPLRENQSVAPNAVSGATFVHEANGMRQMITSLQQSGPRNFGVRDAAVSKVFRNGIEL